MSIARFSNPVFVVRADWLFDAEAVRVLAEEYDSQHKKLPYVGNTEYMAELPPHSRGWFNALAVFPGHSHESLHGKLGVLESGFPIWMPGDMPEPIDAQPVRASSGLILTAEMKMNVSSVFLLRTAERYRGDWQ